MLRPLIFDAKVRLTLEQDYFCRLFLGWDSRSRARLPLSQFHCAIQEADLGLRPPRAGRHLGPAFLGFRCYDGPHETVFGVRGRQFARWVQTNTWGEALVSAKRAKCRRGPPS